MIAELKPYPEYRESALPWLGKVPEHWKQRRTKFLFKERIQKGFPDEPLLAATQSKGVVRKDEYGSRTVTATKDLHLLKLVEQGDYVISLRSFEGGIEVAHSRGIISPAYTVLAPQKEASQGYYTYFFKSPDFIRSLTLFVTGIREGQNIDYERLSRAYLPLPPSDEQAAIVRFLGWANGQLEKAIRAKRKVITLLNEQKQVIIHRAVTRGLDPSVPLKPSGVPWLGDIPKHWEVRPIKTLLRETDRRSLDGADTLLSLTRNRGLIPHSEMTEKMHSANTLVGYKQYKPGQIVMNRMQAWSGMFGSGAVFGLVSPDYAVFDILGGHDVKFVLARHKAKDLVGQFAIASKGIGSGFNRLYTDRFGPIRITIPPIDEQYSIVAYIDRETNGLNSAISRFEREIELLREYRTRLVADVVTGKLDVREAAAKLPDETMSDLSDNDSVEALEDEPFEEEALV